jgi:hypothetical protein
VHVGKGDPLAQIVFIDRTHRRPDIKVLAAHARQSRDLKAAMQEFDRHHREDRNVYKRLVRTQHGQLIHDGVPASSKGKPG